MKEGNQPSIFRRISPFVASMGIGTILGELVPETYQLHPVIQGSIGLLFTGLAISARGKIKVYEVKDNLHKDALYVSNGCRSILHQLSSIAGGLITGSVFVDGIRLASDIVDKIN